MREGERRRACGEREESVWVCGAFAHTPRYASSEFLRECALAAPGDAYHPNDLQRCHDGEEVGPAGRVAAAAASGGRVGRIWAVGGEDGGEGRKERRRRCQSEAGTVGNAGNHPQYTTSKEDMMKGGHAMSHRLSPRLTQHFLKELEGE